MNDFKNYTLSELKIAPEGKEGSFEAVFATLNVIDKDSDVTLNGAFGEQDVVISQYNHGSWEKGASALPIGVEKFTNAAIRQLLPVNSIWKTRTPLRHTKNSSTCNRRDKILNSLTLCQRKNLILQTWTAREYAD